MTTYSTIEAAIRAAKAEIEATPFDPTTFATDGCKPIREAAPGFVIGGEVGEIVGYVTKTSFRTVEEIRGA